nr:uncharacterized protein LOC113404074 [Vanessa tameamea]
MNKAKWKCPSCKQAKKNNNISPITPNVANETNLDLAQPYSNLNTKSIIDHFDERFTYLNSSIESFKSFITNEFKKVTETVNEWTKKIKLVESSIDMVMDQVNNFDKEVTKIHNIELELNELKNSMKDLKDSHYKNEQWVRRSNIQISGVPQKKGENLIQLIKVLADKCNFPLNPLTDIDFITRVATKNDSNDIRPKPIILKMQARYKKDDFLSSLRKLKTIRACDIGFSGMQNQIYVNDHLSTRNKSLFNEAKRKSKEKGYLFCWVRNCTIMVRRTESSPVLHITSEDCLKKIV